MYSDYSRLISLTHKNGWHWSVETPSDVAWLAVRYNVMNASVLPFFPPWGTCMASSVALYVVSEKIYVRMTIQRSAVVYSGPMVERYWVALHKTPTRCCGL